jgi:transcription antitermination factor NusG
MTEATVPSSDASSEMEAIIARLMQSDGAGLWHAAMVPSGREARAGLAILDLGCDAFVPYTYVRVRSSRHAKRMRTVPRVWIPGYVFFRWGVGPIADAGPRWDLLRDTKDAGGARLVLDWIRFGGRAAVVHPEDMRRLIDVSGSARPHAVAGAVRKRLAAGDAATLKSGPFSGFDVRIEDVQGDHADFWVRLFAGEVRGKAHLSQFVEK